MGIGLLAVMGASLGLRLAASGPGGVWLDASLTGAQAGLLSCVALRRFWRGASGKAVLAGGLMVTCVAMAICIGRPRTGRALVAAICHAGIYGGLLFVFGRSLMPGRDAVATGLARRLHGTLTAAREQYTRRVTWMWVIYFGCQFGLSLPLGLSPDWAWGAVMRVLDVPLAVLLLGIELAFRRYWFRGQAHGSAADMLRAYAGRGVPAPGEGVPR
jgi:uncharacterized membrane protein